MNHCIYNAISKDKITTHVFFHQQIIEKNYGQGYEALYHLVAPDHPIKSPRPTNMVQLPLSQLPTHVLAQYLINYIVFPSDASLP